MTAAFVRPFFHLLDLNSVAQRIHWDSTRTMSSFAIMTSFLISTTSFLICAISLPCTSNVTVNAAIVAFNVQRNDAVAVDANIITPVANGMNTSFIHETLWTLPDPRDIGTFRPFRVTRNYVGTLPKHAGEFRSPALFVLRCRTADHIHYNLNRTCDRHDDVNALLN